MRRAAALAVLLATSGSLVPTGSADEPAGETVADDVAHDTTWSGVVRLERRIRVQPGATLRIAAGTRVVVPALDGPGVDVRARFVPGIEVAGALVAEGVSDAPIRFGPPPQDPAKRGAGRPLPVWFGVVALPVEGNETNPRPAPRVEVSHALFERAFAGVQAGRSQVGLRSCAFHDCTAGVETGELWESFDRYIGPAGDVAPRLEDCRFGGCRVGVAVEGKGRPAIERSLFAGCTLGLGNKGPFQVIHPLESLGPRADRCEFVRCELAVYGASYVTNSIFEGNVVVFEATSLHDEFTTQIDRYVRVGNLYGPGQTLTRSDVPLGEGARLAPPGRRGSLAVPLTVEALMGDLAPVLGLTPGSPGSGAGAGADVGLFAGAGAPPTGRTDSPAPAGLVVDRWLAAGPPGSTDVDVAALAKAVGAKRRFGGDVDGNLQWATVGPETLADPAAGRAAFGGPGRPRVLLAAFDSPRDGGAVLQLGWDGTLAAWWNGQPLGIPSGTRRFRPDDASVPLVGLPGTNVLVLRHVPRDSSSRLLIRLLDPIRGQGPPASLAIVPPARPADKAAPAFGIRTAVWREPRAPVGSVDTASLEIAFTAPVHWIDASTAKSYAVSDAQGRPIGSAERPFVHRGSIEPRKSTALVTCGRLSVPGTYRVTVSGLRHPDGSGPYPTVSATFKVP